MNLNLNLNLKHTLPSYNYIQNGDTIPTTPSTANLGDNFSYSIDSNVDGSFIIIGNPYDTNNTGAVYVYQLDSTKDTWNNLSLTKGSSANDYYGFSTQISNDGSTFSLYSINGVIVYTYSQTYQSYIKLGDTILPSGYSVTPSTPGNIPELNIALAGSSNIVAFSVYDSTQQMVVLVYRFVNGSWSRIGSVDIPGQECAISYHGEYLIVSLDHNIITYPHTIVLVILGTL